MRLSVDLADDGRPNRRGSFVAGFVAGLVLGTLLGFGTLVGLVIAADRAGAGVDHVHASSRYDRSPASLHRQALRFAGADVTTWTEVSRPARKRALAVSGVRVWSPPGQLAITYARSWATVDRGSYRPTRAVYRSKSGRLVVSRVVWAVLQRAGVRVLVTVTHLPAHVQAGDHWQQDHPQRVRVWKLAVAGWAAETTRQRARYDPDATLVVADWNVDVRRAVWRRIVARRFPGLRLTWRPPYPRAGTAGRRLIDATLTDARGRAQLLPGDASSDHRPYLERLDP